MSRRNRPDKHSFHWAEVRAICWRVLSFALPQWRILLVALVMTAIYSAANTSRVVVLGLVFDGVLVPAETPEERGKLIRYYERFLAPHLPEGLQLEYRRKPQKMELERFVLRAPRVVEIDRAAGVLRAFEVQLAAEIAEGQGRHTLDAHVDGVEVRPQDPSWIAGQPVPALPGGAAVIEISEAQPGGVTGLEQLTVDSFVVLDFKRFERLADDPRVLELRDAQLAYRFAPEPAAHLTRQVSGARITVQDAEAPLPIEVIGARARVERSFGAPRDPAGVLPGLTALALLAAVLAIVIASSNFFQEVLAQRFVFRTIAALRQALFQHLTRLGLDYYSNRRSGDLISRLTNDVSTVQFSMRFFFSNALQQPFTLLFSLALTFFACWQLALLNLVFMPLLMWPILRSGRRVHKHGRGSLSRLGELTETMGQLLSGIRVVKAFGLEEVQATEFRHRNASFVKSMMKMVRARTTSRSLVEGLYNLLAALILVVGGWMLAHNVFGLTIGQFATFLGGTLGMYMPLRALVKAYNTLQESVAGAGRIFEVMNEQPTIRDAPGAGKLPPFRSEVRFEGVWFRYGEEQPWVLRGIDLQARAGETVALVGPTGAGKSTMLDLLARFHDPQRGCILVDGHDLRNVQHGSLLAQIAIVGQDPFLFNSSIRENIRHGRQDATEAEIEAAARAAQIHDEIAAMPDGYDTNLGERGMKVSGGQRQRITIARAVLKSAPILILDEATSSLDSASERQVQAALEALMRGRTTFVIAHRLSTILHADRILVLEGGQVVEQGTHAELMARDGLYARLQRLQNEVPEAATPRTGGE